MLVREGHDSSSRNIGCAGQRKKGQRSNGAGRNGVGTASLGLYSISEFFHAERLVRFRPQVAMARPSRCFILLVAVEPMQPLFRAMTEALPSPASVGLAPAERRLVG